MFLFQSCPLLFIAGGQTKYAQILPTSEVVDICGPATSGCNLTQPSAIMPFMNADGVSLR